MKPSLLPLLTLLVLGTALLPAQARAKHPVHHAVHHASGPSSAALRAKQHALQLRQSQLAGRLSVQRARAAFLKEKEIKESKNLVSLQQKLEQTSTEFQDSQFRLQRAQVKLNYTKSKLQVAKGAFYGEQRAANSRLRSIYKNRGLNAWEALLTSQDLTTFLTRVEFFKRISDHDAALLDDLAMRKRVIHEQQQDYAQQKQTIARVTASIGTQKVQLAGMTDQQSQLVASIKTQRQAAEQAVSQMESDSNQIQAMIRRYIAMQQEIERRARAQNPHYVGPILGTGRFSWPLIGPITSPFGFRFHPILHRMIKHEGIDIAAAYGTPIRAADNGVVLYAGWYGGYGKAVQIFHGGQLTSLYGHTSSYVVSIGEHVKKGQIIAYVGMTGMTTGPHVHFEVRLNGVPVNPLGYLQGGHVTGSAHTE